MSLSAPEPLPIPEKFEPQYNQVLLAISEFIEACELRLHHEEADGFNFRFWLTDPSGNQVWETYSCRHLNTYEIALTEALKYYYDQKTNVVAVIQGDDTYVSQL